MNRVIGFLRLRKLTSRTGSGHRVIGKIEAKALSYSNFVVAAALLLFILAEGCAPSGLVQVTVTNASTEKISTITVDYPEATFGIGSLLPGKSFRYKIKPTATGALKIEFINNRGQSRMSSGPVVHKNDEGSIEIKLTQDGAASEIRTK